MTKKPTRKKKETFGDMVKRRLNAAGWSQVKAAKKLGVDRGDFNRLCNNKRNPRGHELEWLALFFSVTLEQLVEGVTMKKDARRVVDEVLKRAKQLQDAENGRVQAEAKLTEATQTHTKEVEALRAQLETLQASFKKSQEELESEKRRRQEEQQITEDKLKTLWEEVEEKTKRIIGLEAENKELTAKPKGDEEKKNTEIELAKPTEPEKAKSSSIGWGELFLGALAVVGTTSLIDKAISKKSYREDDDEEYEDEEEDDE